VITGVPLANAYSITIDTQPWTDIAFLSWVEVVSESLTILNCPNFQTLGITNLKVVNAIDIRNCSALTDFALFSTTSTFINLTTLTIMDNDMMTSLSGFPKTLNTVESFVLMNMLNLTDLSLSFLVTNSLTIQNCTELTSISSIGGVAAWLETVQIQDNPLLTDLVGLEGLKEVFSNLKLINLASLASMQGLNNVTGLNGLTIDNCTSLETLQGLNRLTYVNYSLEIHECDYLANLTGLESVYYIGYVDFDKLGSLRNMAGLSGLQLMGLGDIPYYNTISFANLFAL